MKLIDLHEEKSQFFTEEVDIRMWLHSIGVKNFEINNDLSVRVTGDVRIVKTDLKYLPVQFTRVGGDFICTENYWLKSLKGCPTFVGGHFRCDGCESLTSLEGAPAEVNHMFYCHNCDSLKSLKDIHKYVKIIGGKFDCFPSDVTSNVLGLLKIKKLHKVLLPNQKLQNIINKYLPEGNILDCIDELEDAGLEAFAKL